MRSRATDTQHATVVPSRRAQAFVAVLAAAALVHTVVVGLWATPPNPVSEAAGQDRLKSYVVPWWGQSWSIFAPIPLRADWSMRVRAKIEDPLTDRVTVTRWFSVNPQRSVNPNRAGLAPRQVVRSRNDDVQVRFATDYARAMTSGHLVAVEFDLGYRRVPPYDGHAIDFDDVVPATASSGWREPR